jgi:hypothetical protein
MMTRMVCLKKSIIVLVVTLSLCVSIIVESAYTDSVAEHSDLRGQQQVDSIVSTDFQRLEHSLSPSDSVPKPSPLLLFSMGLLGVICVIINERKKKSRGL